VQTEDERFKDIKELVHIYAGISTNPEDSKEDTFKKLYTTIMLLEEEKRIADGKGFHLESYNQSEIDQIWKQLKVLLNAVAIVDQRVDSTNKVIRKALKEGRVIKP
jgi:hypothetical protein